MNFEDVKVDDYVYSNNLAGATNVLKDGITYKVLSRDNNYIFVEKPDVYGGKYTVGKQMWEKCQFQLEEHSDIRKPFRKQEYASMFDAYLIVGDYTTCGELHRKVYGEETG